MRKIERIGLFVNHNSKSQTIEKMVIEALQKKNFTIVTEDFDLGIAIGGDGSFLRMIKNSNFNSSCYYVGVHAGTLGFAQEVSIEGIYDFVDMIDKDQFKYEEIGVQEIEVTTPDSVSKHFSLNEMVVRDQELNTSNLLVTVNDVLLEDYVGDGLLVATSFGSTAYNLSFGGSIVYNTFHTLQITPIAPLNNKSYRNLLNSVIIPDNQVIGIVPKNDKNNLIISIDGENYNYDKVEKIETFIDKKRIRVLRMNDYNFIQKINEKFLK